MKINLAQLTKHDIHLPVVVPSEEFTIVVKPCKDGRVNAYRSYTQAKWLLKQSYRDGVYVTLAKIKRLGFWIQVEVHTDNGANIRIGAR